jgi:GTP pyrophosphokinase
MHHLAEHGVAAHWQYKETGKGSKSRDKARSRDLERFSWLRQIMDWQKETKDPREFMASLRFDLFADEVYVFTPQGQVKELPEGATPVDFAYLIHTEVGDHCTGAKVNGKLVPLATKLRNGDTIEILTDGQRHPSRDWLKFVKTGKARSRIKHFIRTEERERSISLAKEMLEKEGRKMGINVQKALHDGLFEPLAGEFSYNTVEDLLSAVGYARITPRKVLNRLLPKEEPEPAEKEKPPHEPPPPKKTSDSVRIKGVDNVLVRYAQCCDPLPGEPIVGYITRGRGVTVHTADCPHVMNFEEERLIDISWEGEEDKPYPAKISIKCDNKKGTLARIAEHLSRKDVNIDSGTFISNEDGSSELVFKIEVRNSSHLYETMESLSRLENVLDVSRMTVS